MVGNLGYFTIPVRDLDRGKLFYGGLFGWQFEPGATGDNDNYAHAADTTPPGGVHVDANRSSAQVWFRIADIQAAVAKVRELGGECDEPSESASGWSAACRDDQGTTFNLWQPAPGF